MVEAGYGDLHVLARAEPQKLSKLKGIGKKKAASIIEEAGKKLKEAQLAAEKLRVVSVPRLGFCPDRAGKE